MKVRLLAILLFFFCVISTQYNYASEEYTYPALDIRLKGKKVIIVVNDKKYSYPTLIKRSIGIKKVVIEDITGDGKVEYIVAVQAKGVTLSYSDGDYEELPDVVYGTVLICQKRLNRLDIKRQIIVGDSKPDFQIIDVNQDGIKDVVAKGLESPRWVYMKIVSWSKGQFHYLWNKGADAAFVQQEFVLSETGTPQIRVASPLGYQMDGSFSYEPDWQTWVWGKDSFVEATDSPQ